MTKGFGTFYAFIRSLSSMNSLMLSKHWVVSKVFATFSTWIWSLAIFSPKFSKWGFNSTWTESFQMFKLDLEMAEEPEIQLPTSLGSYKKQESSGKTTASAVLTTPQPLIVWITRNCGKFLKRWEHQTTYLPPEKSVCMSRSNSENWTCYNAWIPNWEISTSRLYIVTLHI